MKRIILFVVTVLLVGWFLPSQGQVMWNLKIGAMPKSVYTSTYLMEEGEKDSSWDYMGGLEVEIPLNEKFNIDFGARYKYHRTFVLDENNSHDYYTADTHLEFPLRLTYKQPLGEHFTFHAGLGPYFSYAFPDGDDLGEDSKNFQIGLEPSVVVNWKCLSLGMTYNLPCFYKGYKDENNPGFMITLGVRFPSHVWKYVGAVALGVVTAGAALAAAWPSGDNDYSGYGSSTYSSSSASGSHSSSSSSSSGGGNISEQQNYNTDKRTYANYDTMLSGHFYGSRAASGGEVRQWQQAMKDLRKKWTAKGKNFTQSSNETKSTNDCPNSSHTH